MSFGLWDGRNNTGNENKITQQVAWIRIVIHLFEYHGFAIRYDLFFPNLKIKTVFGHQNEMNAAKVATKPVYRWIKNFREVTFLFPINKQITAFLVLPFPKKKFKRKQIGKYILKRAKLSFSIVVFLTVSSYLCRQIEISTF